MLLWLVPSSCYLSLPFDNLSQQFPFPTHVAFRHLAGRLPSFVQPCGDALETEVPHELMPHLVVLVQGEQTTPCLLVQLWLQLVQEVANFRRNLMKNRLRSNVALWTLVTYHFTSH